MGAELDDLVQEGLIFVWQSFGRGVYPNEELIEGRMLNWIRLMARQTGQDIPSCRTDEDGNFVTHDENGEPLLEPCPQHIPYDQMLPLDDFRVVREG